MERHDAFSVFLDFFPAIVQTLEHFTKLPNTRTPGAADATSLLYSICNFAFVVAIVIVQMCLAFMKGLSRSLQERSLEVGRALENVNLVQSSLEDCREHVEQFNRKCYERSLKICAPLDIEFKKPRTCGRQTMRDNVQSEGPEDYFRKSVTTFPRLYDKRNEDKVYRPTRQSRFGASVGSVCNDNVTKVRRFLFFLNRLSM